MFDSSCITYVHSASPDDQATEDDQFYYSERNMPKYSAIDWSVDVDEPQRVYPTKRMVRELIEKQDELIKAEVSAKSDGKDELLSINDSLNKPISINEGLNNAWGNLGNLVKETVAPMISVVMSEAFKRMASDFTKVIAGSLKELKSSGLDSEAMKALRYLSFVKFVKDNNWPLFLIDEVGFVDEILEIKSGKSDKKIEDVVYLYLDDDYIDEMLKFWGEVDNINPGRMPI